MDASGLKRFKELEAHTAQTDVCRAGTGQRGDEGPGRKKTVGPAQKREAVRYLVEVHARQLRRSCDCVGLSRSAWHAPPLDWTVRDAEIIGALARLVEAEPSRGIGKCCQILERSHPHWSHRLVYRVYCAMTLNLRHAARRSLPKRACMPLYVPEYPGRVWVGRLHARCLGLRPLVRDLQPARRLPPRGGSHRSGHLDHLGPPGANLRAHRPKRPLPQVLRIDKGAEFHGEAFAIQQTEAAAR